MNKSESMSSSSKNRDALNQPSASSKRALEDFYVQSEKENDEFACKLIIVLKHVIHNSKETTMQGLNYEIKSAGEYVIENVKNQAPLNGRSELVLRSTFNIYLHYMSQGLINVTGDNIFEVKQSLIGITESLIEIMKNAKDEIQKTSLRFLRNQTKILVYGYSTVVLSVLNQAYKTGISLELLIPEVRPKCEGLETYKRLKEIGYPCKLIFDTAIGYALEECDMVLMGAEAVAENGGIINRAGTYTTALCAKALSKPFYVFAESFKFARELFPLAQQDLNNNIRTKPEKQDLLKQETMDMEYLIPQCDYTPPELITLLFTDVGIFTPSAVSEELIKIFNT